MLRAPTAVLLALASLVSIACNKKDETLSTEPLELIPADLQGIYGRTPNDAPGMTVSATGLEFDEMKLVIHQGKMEGDTVRVERATLQWEKLEPKTCTGTISREGDRLLMSLYEIDGAKEKCESVLAAEWFRWQPLTELPASMHGRYDAGAETLFSIAGNSMRLDLGWFRSELTTRAIAQLPGSNDVRTLLLIDDAKVVYEGDDLKIEIECAGTIELEDGWLSSDFWLPRRFEPVPGGAELDEIAKQKLDEHREGCEAWDGRAHKFEVSMEGLPKAPIKKGEVSLAIGTDKPDMVVLDSPALRCEQELWGTESVPSGYGVFGGQRMTLGKAEPTRVSDACRRNMRIWCERQEGTAPADVDLAALPSEWVAGCMQTTERELCPATITVQAISDLRYKFMVAPITFNELACVDTTGDFTLQK
jgi:hypothetical protein